jgi:hypothetical protein
VMPTSTDLMFATMTFSSVFPARNHGRGEPALTSLKWHSSAS